MQLSPTQWSQVEELFLETIALAPTERQNHLERSAAESAVRAEVESMLRAHDTPGEFLSRPATVVATEAQVEQLPAGARLGSWRVLRLLGRGGMGSVYQVERADGQFQQLAAAKLLQQESALLLERFNTERQILARLDHPGIARLLDGGVSESGFTYAVMEYVEGQTITDACRTRRASLPERLRLLVQVCDAVSEAHRNLVVHRDLKPANILVGTDGRTRLLDFGIAKLLEPTSWPAGQESLSNHALFTPDYASPEQIAGKPITTATDVHALGLLLFELVVGRRAWSLAGEPLATAVKVVLETPVPRPSEAATESGPVPPKLLRGDLDAIVGKCLHKEPAERYPSVEALRLDLERSLRGEPVSAREQGRLYVLDRFVRRHLLAVTAAAGGALLLVGLSAALAVQLGAVSRERDRANRETQAAERVTTFMTGLFRISEPGEARGNSVTAREVLDRGAEKIEKELTGDPALQARLAATMGEVYGTLGLYGPARTLLERAVETRTRVLGASAPDTLMTRLQLGIILNNQGDCAAVEKLTREVRELARPLTTERRVSINAAGLLSHSLQCLGKLEEAVEVQTELLTLSSGLHGPDSTQAAAAMNGLANSYLLMGRYQQAAPLARRALEVRSRALGADHPLTLESMTTLAKTNLRLGDHAEAERLLSEVVSADHRVLGPSHLITLNDSSELAVIYFVEGKLDEAEKLYRETLEAARRTLGDDHPLASNIAIRLGDTYARQGRFSEQQKVHLEVLASEERARGTTSPDRIRVLYALAIAATREGDADKAIGWLRQFMELGMLPDLAKELPDESEFESLHGDPRFEVIAAEAKKRSAQ